MCDYLLNFTKTESLKTQIIKANTRGITKVDCNANRSFWTFMQNDLEALSVHDGRTGILVLGLGDPHGLESSKGGKDGSSNPHGVLTLGRSDDLDAHGRRGKGSDLLGETLCNSLEHSRTSGAHNVGVQVLSDINITGHDRVERGLVDTLSLLSDHAGLEECLGALESGNIDGDHVSVRKLVVLGEVSAGSGVLELLIVVESDVSKLLLNISDDLTLCGRGERVSLLLEALHHPFGEVTSGEIQTLDGVRKSVSLVDGHSVRDTITRVEDTSSGTSGSVQGKNGLNLHVHGGNVESLEVDLSHSLSVLLGVQGSLSEHDRVFLGGNTKLVVVGVMPDLLHVIPGCNDTVCVCV